MPPPCPVISQVIIADADRLFLTAGLALDAGAAAEWTGRTGRSPTVDALVEDDALRAALDEAVARVNELHSHAEGIRRRRNPPHDLTVAEGELTPTLEVRRAAVTAGPADLVDEMCADQLA